MPSWLKDYRSTPFFTQAFIELNQLQEKAFKAWVFHRHMLFGGKCFWWGEKKKRPGPHEGIDLCFYLDGRNKIVTLDERIKIPAAYDGKIVKIFDDFLGRSIFLEHRLPQISPAVFLTFYGHTLPSDDVTPGCSVKQGQRIATVAPPKNSVPPHLHVTTAWSSKTPNYDSLDWTNITEDKQLQLSDPLPFLGGKFIMVSHDSLVKSLTR
ncbi:MAG TPA: M23 family metallopeptidase [Thermodesulfobacteriota bacterium]|nr:M23 family metallopeptidase [Thermodesulfobacteriota bacterium]